MFPDEETGRNALISMLRDVPDFSDGTLNEAIATYAPEEDGNPTKTYQAFAQKETGLSGDKILNTFTPEELAALAGTIVKFEGWKEGESTFSE